MAVTGGSGLRRAMDVTLASFLVVLAAPVLLVGAALVYVRSGRPVFFGHERLGTGGRTFRCWKLRTMTHGAERELEERPELKDRYVQNGFKLPTNGDPRVTPEGRWLRRRHIDELPQLFNVLEGSMSLVGPRPVVREELREYGSRSGELLSGKPGIVGAWTSLGDRRPPYPERADIELEYLRTRSLTRDLGILARSVLVVAQGQREQ